MRNKLKCFIYCTATASLSTLLIGYYHVLLLKDIEANFLINRMSTNGLLSSFEEELICNGHSAYQRNWLLLEYVRHMQIQTLMVFCEFVQEIAPKVGLQLVTGKHYYSYLVKY